MAIYRPPKARWPLAIGTAAAGLVVGLSIGLAVGDDEPSAKEGAAVIKTSLVSAAGSLEVAGIEYEESIADGRVVEEAEFDGALAAVESSRSKFETIEPALSSIAPGITDPIGSLYGAIEEAMRAHADPAEVSMLVDELIDLLKGGPIEPEGGPGG